MSTSVKYYNSTMSGAPSLSGTAGALISVLDGCLVDGFGSVTVDSLVVASNVATATVSAGHQFAMIGNTGPVIQIAGASPSGLNGDWRVTVISSTEFTFATTGISDQTATGTITAKRAPAGFSKAFSDTNKAAYRSDDITGTRLYCRIDDSTTTYARIRGYESMTGIDTDLVGPFPTDAQLSGGEYVYKSNAASSATRPWALVSDGRMVYFFCDPAGSGTWTGGFWFGDLDSYVVSDGYGCIMIGSNSASGDFLGYAVNGSSVANYLARAITQTGGSLATTRYSNGKSAGLGASGPAYDSDNVLLWPIEAWDGTTSPHGLMPGLWNPICTSVLHGEILEGVPQLSGRTLITQIIATSRSCAIDLTGTWR